MHCQPPPAAAEVTSVTQTCTGGMGCAWQPGPEAVLGLTAGLLAERAARHVWPEAAESWVLGRTAGSKQTLDACMLNRC